MYRALPALVALCCVLSGVTVGITAPGPSPAVEADAVADSNDTVVQHSIEDVPNTSNYLEHEGADVRAVVGEPSLNVGAAVAADATRLHTEFAVGPLDDEFRDAESHAERASVLRTFADRIENRTERLQSRERAALDAFNGNEITADEYLRRLAEIDAAAERITIALGQLEQFSDAQGDPVSKRRLGRVRTALLSLQGPVRDRVAAVAAGSASPSRILVDTSDSGVVLSTVVERSGRPTLLREAYVPSGYDESATDAYRGDSGALFEHVLSLYSWTKTQPGQRNILTGPAPAYSLYHAGVYEVMLGHSQGQVTAFLDGGTDEVFREIQRKHLAAVPVGENTTNASDGLRLTVARTRSGGPVRVDVRDNATGEPVDARITFERSVGGETGDDGRLWALAPTGPVHVTASTDAGNVSVSHTVVVVRGLDDDPVRPSP